MAGQFEDDRTESYVALTKGTIVGHYRMVEKIGAGGMGEVYLAEDTTLKRMVALKFMPSHLATNADMRERFMREARAVAALSHPNIVTIYEVGEFNGRPYFAMEHVVGESLRTVIKQGRLTTDEAVRLTMQICAGLKKAHEMGVVHRDIKPGNVIIGNDGRARILDFGLAMVSGEEKLTKTGSTLGTVGYMSPEQVKSQKVDHRSDLFSVGVILYEMLTGRRPFEGDNDAAIVNAITNSTPEPVARFKSGTTGELQRIVDKALQKAPSLRYQHADGMLADLKRLELGGITSRKSRLWLWATFAAVLILAGWFVADRLFLSAKGKAGKWSNSIAVLVFRDQSQEQDQGFFCEGMTDAIIGRLSGISDLKVISLTSVLGYAAAERDLKKIGHDLGVENILEGSIMRSGDRVRIRAQLIDVDEDAHLWSQQYDRRVQDIFAIQDEISRTIVNVMRVQLVGGESTSLAGRGTDDIEAYNLYLQARHLWRKRVGKDILKTIEYLEQAIALDPDYVQAYAALADAWAILPGYHSEISWSEALPKAKEAALKAIELDESCAEAHAALGLIYSSEANNAQAEEQFRRAIDLNPGYAWAHLWYSNLLERIGDREGKIRELELTLELDPLSIVALNNLAGLKEQDEQPEEAERLYRRLLEVTPDAYLFRIRFGAFLIREDKVEQGLAEFRKAIEHDPFYWPSYFTYAGKLEELGRSEEAEQVMLDVLQAHPEEAILYQGYGDLLFNRRQDYRGALPKYRRAADLDPGNPQPLNSTAYCYLGLEMADSARWAVNEAIALDPENDEFYDSKGEICSRLGLLDTAIVAYRRCLELNPDRSYTNTGAHLSRIAVLAGEFELADSLSSLWVNRSEPGFRAWGDMYKAEALIYQGKFRQAIIALQESAKRDSLGPPESTHRAMLAKHGMLTEIYAWYVKDSAEALAAAWAGRRFALHHPLADSDGLLRPFTSGRMATIAARYRDFDMAARWLDTLIREADTTVEGVAKWIRTAQAAVALSQGDFESAAGYVEEDGYANVRAVAFLRSGQIERAIEFLEPLTRNCYLRRGDVWLSTMVWSHYALGTAYEAAGRTVEAIEQHEIFLDIWRNADEGLASVEDARERLSRLKGELQ